MLLSRNGAGNWECPACCKEMVSEFDLILAEKKGEILKVCCRNIWCEEYGVLFLAHALQLNRWIQCEKVPGVWNEKTRLKFY